MRRPDLDRATIIATGATNLQRVFSPEQLIDVRKSYLDGLHAAWAMAIAFAGVALLTGLSLGFKAIKKPQEKTDESDEKRVQQSKGRNMKPFGKSTV